MRNIKLLVMVAVLISLCSPLTVFGQSVEQRFIKAGLIDIQLIDARIAVDLVNSDAEKNFFKNDFYGELDKAYLREGVARKLKAAQDILEKQKPGYRLCILDAARPLSVTKAMYEQMKGTRFERYVARPEKGSMHNYGVAVDITLLDRSGERLDMGPSPFYASRMRIYMQYAQMKMGIKLTKSQQDNRRLLAQVMTGAGFFPLAHEWWHFNGMKKEDARRVYVPVQ